MCKSETGLAEAEFQRTYTKIIGLYTLDQDVQREQLRQIMKRLNTKPMQSRDSEKTAEDDWYQ